ncbi:MAG: ribonuclease R [Ruminococcus sp.]|jgi:ribonuclease R|nr:ribonuclease R [Ruminococcus sp.]
MTKKHKKDIKSNFPKASKPTGNPGKTSGNFGKHAGNSGNTVKKSAGQRAVLLEINGTYGFCENTDGKRFFIPGRCLCGAMPGDTVTINVLPESRGTSDEAEITEIITESDRTFTGVIESFDGYAYIRPDIMPREVITVFSTVTELFEGDKVQFTIASRGRRHSDHKADVTMVFGDSEKASVCAAAVIASAGVPTVFSEEVLSEAERINLAGIPEEEYEKRLDLRGRLIFTIDGADTKDIDDAVSLKKVDGGWELGVHIADVSHYVKGNLLLDITALERGTSIYYADKVIPMLPKALSNGICSLNPNEDRLAFSCLMRLDEKGKLGLFKFSKTVINSRVKGVYSEVNRILSQTPEQFLADTELSKKYDGLYETIHRMNELSDILIRRRVKRGAPEIETEEAKITLDRDGVCIDVKKRTRGKSERIIEEFMLIANKAAAKLAKEHSAPFVYRVHEKPPEQKVKDLTAFLLHIGLTPPPSAPEPKDMAKILAQTEDEPMKPAVNMMVLRTLAKAKYSEEPLGHYGLALDDYAHFTSPIRRYPDLAIHRILTDICYKKKPIEKLVKKYKDFVKTASEQATKTEIRAVDIERKTEDLFAAEFLKEHLGEIYDGIIMTVLKTGFFVQLDNTIEGFVRLDSLPKPPYDYDGYISFTKNGKRAYTVGDKISVQVAAVDVPLARIDFVIA